VLICSLPASQLRRVVSVGWWRHLRWSRRPTHVA
jgi:hypothetical protein